LNYKLIAIDLDGTIVKDTTVIPSARKAIHHAIARGMAVVLATGRIYQPANTFAVELGISHPIICNQGALIKVPNYGDTIWHKPLTIPSARSVIEITRQIDAHKYVYLNNMIFVEEDHIRDQRYAQVHNVRIQIVDDLMTILSQRPTGIAVLDEMEKIDQFISDLRAKFNSKLVASKVHSSFCEVVHSDAGKGKALKYLAGIMGIDRSQTVAIGDSANDIGMLQWAGLGIAVGNVHDEVRDAADWVIDTQDEHSFAEAMDRVLSN